MITCPKCLGTGTVYEMGMVYGESDCSKCKGTGNISGRISLFRWLMWWIGGKK